VQRGEKALYREAYALIDESHKARERGKIRSYRAQQHTADLDEFAEVLSPRC
jgi:hypothetical protein